MVDKSIVTVVQAYLTAVEQAGVPVAFGVVFGSWAKGMAGPWSDIDILVVSPQFDGPRNRADTALLWHMAARVDSRIEPIACGVQQWIADDNSAIIEIARRGGQRVSLREAA